jgi:hypothetical protein
LLLFMETAAITRDKMKLDLLFLLLLRLLEVLEDEMSIIVTERNNCANAEKRCETNVIRLLMWRLYRFVAEVFAANCQRRLLQEQNNKKHEVPTRD